MYSFERIKKNLKSRSVGNYEEGEDGCRGIIVYRAHAFRFQFSFGMEWEHVSVSLQRRTPTWEEMCFFKDIFWLDTEACLQFHPKKAEHVNCHRYCLHIWRPCDGEFPSPPSEMVGPL